MLQLHSRALRPQPHLPVTPKFIIWLLIISVVLILLPTGISILQTNSPTASVSTVLPVDAATARLHSENSAVREQAIQQLAQAARAGSTEAVDQLVAAFQRDEFLADDSLSTARALASIGSPPAYQALIQGFQQRQPSTRRYAAMAALDTADPTVVPYLIAALRDRDAGMRRTSAEILGFRRESTAAEALLIATYDADARVREASVWALGGDLANWQALPRMQLLQSLDTDVSVREAARLAEDRIRSTIAWALGLAPADLWAVTIASPSGQAYAATMNALYVLHGNTSWQRVSLLPDAPTALVAGGPAGQVVYLGTIASGPYRSHDGGQTWERILNGLPAAERLTVTALAINPESQSAQQVYMALEVTIGTSQLHTTPLGIFRSDDGGETWVAIDYLSTRLIIDPATPNYLYGLTEVGAWQTALPQ